MDKEPKSIWKKSFKGRIAWLIWLGVAVFTIMLGSFIIALCQYIRPISDLLLAAGILAGVLFLVILFSIYVAWPLFRLLVFKHWRRTLFGLASFATLIALIYAEEDWRGRHDWNRFEQQWKAKGESFDFKAFVPSSVPDDQNFAFSPVWIAAEKFNFLHSPEKAKAWYGDRIDDPEVTKLIPLLPIQVSGLTGTNLNVYVDSSPEITANWAAARIADLKPWQSYYRDMGATNPTANIPIAPQPQSPAADVLLALNKYDPVINQLRADSARPDSRFPITYNDDNKAAILLPHLAAIKRSAQVLELEAIAELQAGQSEKALADVKLMMRLTASTRTEPFIICQLVRISILQLTLQPTYEGLAEHQWTDAQLAEIDSELENLHLLADCQRVQKAEMAFNVAETDFFKRNRYFVSVMNSMGFDSGRVPEFKAIIYQYAPGGWFFQSALHNCQMNMQYLPAVNLDDHTVSPQKIDQANEAAVNAAKHFDVLDCVKQSFSSDVKFMGNFIKKMAYAQASVDLARVAIALERYRLAHGAYPESLPVLVPQFIAKLPPDVMSGQPLHYRRNSDGSFVLYSVGWNETNDGGMVAYRKKTNPPSMDIDQGDWVWRYPEN